MIFKSFLFSTVSCFLSISAWGQWQLTGCICGGVHVTSSGNTLFAASPLKKSVDGGQTWTSLVGVPTFLTITALVSTENMLLVGTSLGQIYRSIDQGITWNNTNPTFSPVHDFVQHNGVWFSASKEDGIRKSVDNGLTWQFVSFSNSNLTSLVSLGGNLFVGKLSGGVYRSTNNGANWTAVNTGITNLGIQDLAVQGNTLFAGTLSGLIYRSTNNGDNWTLVKDATNSWLVMSLLPNNGSLFASAGDKLFVSQDNGENWTLTPANGFVSMAVAGGEIFGADSVDIWKRSISDLVTGISKTSAKELTHLFPNPTNSRVMIRLTGQNQPGKNHLEVLNIFGQSVLQTVLQNTENELDLHHLPSGIYSVRLLGGGKIQEQKLVKY